MATKKKKEEHKYVTANYGMLVRMIRDMVRVEAEDVPKFRDEGNGAIRILIYPLCKEADNWLGGLGNFKEKGTEDIPDYEWTFAITSGGSRVITCVWDGVEQKCDCYAYSALKIAHCSRAQDMGVGLLSGLKLNDPDLTEDNGYGPHLGALCVEVKAKTVGKKRATKFCGIYVCVSGADSVDDLKCAFAGIRAISAFFRYAAEDFVEFQLKHAKKFPSKKEVEQE